MKVLSVCIAFALLLGWTSVSAAADSPDTDAIGTLGMSCKKPYVLTQDCSGWSGAKRKVILDGFEVKVAGSADGKVILVMDAHLLRNSVQDPFTLTNPTHTAATNNSYSAVRRVLDAQGVAVLKVRPIKSLGNIDGYILELESDGYALLLPFTKQ